MPDYKTMYTQLFAVTELVIKILTSAQLNVQISNAEPSPPPEFRVIESSEHCKNSESADTE